MSGSGSSWWRYRSRCWGPRICRRPGSALGRGWLSAAALREGDPPETSRAAGRRGSHTWVPRRPCPRPWCPRAAGRTSWERRCGAATHSWICRGGSSCSASGRRPARLPAQPRLPGAGAGDRLGHSVAAGGGAGRAQPAPRGQARFLEALPGGVAPLRGRALAGGGSPRAKEEAGRQGRGRRAKGEGGPEPRLLELPGGRRGEH